MEKGFAPYNFVPFNKGKVPIRYVKREDLPFHNQTKGEYTGYISYDVNSLSPIAVEGERVSVSNTNGKSYFARDARGNYILPGSTMRGLFRSHGEILSSAFPDNIDDNFFMFRKFADKSKTFRDEYAENFKPSEENMLRIPEGVKAGYIFAESKNGSKIYKIATVKEFGQHGTNFFKVHESDLRKAKGVHLDKDNYMYFRRIQKYKDCKEEKSLKEYKDELKDMANRNYKPYRGVKVSFDYNGGVCNIGHGSLRGELLNSAYIQGKTSHYIVSTEQQANEKLIEVDDKYIHAYEKDYERNCIQNKKLKVQKDFYELPKRLGEKKLFFYKLGADGKIIGFGPTPYFRVFYKNSTRAGVPLTKDEGYDYVQSIFGFVDRNKSYKGRVSFTNCVLQNKTTSESKKLYSASPKGTAIQMYLDQTGKNVNNLSTFNQDDFALRGQKIYWKRQNVVNGEAISFKNGQKQYNSNSEIETLPKGCRFSGKIYFENLSKDELGLLLYCLRLENDKKESYLVGNGKQFGYGMASIDNIKLWKLSPSDRFASINVGFQEITNEIDDIKGSYYDIMKNTYDFDIKDNNNKSVYTYKKWVQMEPLVTKEPVYMPLNSKGEQVSYTQRDILPTALEIIESKQYNNKKR